MSDSALVGFEVGKIVMLQTHSQTGEFVDCSLDVIYRKIQIRDRSRGMFGFGIQEHSVLAGMQLKPFRCFRNVESEPLAVKLFGLFQIVYGKTRERLSLIENG